MMDENKLNGEIEKVREESRTALRRGAYWWLVMVLTAVTSAGASIAVTYVSIQRSERKLCAVVTTTDDAYHRVPPLTEPGRQQAANFNRLRHDLGCPPYKEKR